jgi:hypothetical protein
MRIVVLILLTTLYSCNSQVSSKPKDKLQDYFGKIKDFTKTSGEFEAQRYYYSSGVIDTVRVLVKNGIVKRITRSDGSSYEDNIVLDSTGKGNERDYGIFKLNIYADYLENKITVNTPVENKIKLEENKEKEIETSKIEAEPNSNIEPIQNQFQSQQSNQNLPKKEETYYYKISCDNSWGVETLKCHKSDNSIGESCHSVGSLKSYGKCIGAFIWNQNDRIGAIMWTNTKLVYEGLEGNSGSGSRIMYEIPSNKIEAEKITYCTPKGNQIEIHTTTEVIYR